MFAKRSKIKAVVISLFTVFLFTLTSNVVFDPSPVWAAGKDVSQRDTESETAQASKNAQDKLSGAAEGASGFFGSILNWIKGVTQSINKMWGMENGSGVAMVVNGIFYLLLLVIVGFSGKMIINIFKDSVKGKVDERYQKPSFRKK